MRTRTRGSTGSISMSSPKTASSPAWARSSMKPLSQGLRPLLRMHDLEFEHLHVDPGDEINEIAWTADNVELTTVGIDIGSSTSHLMFARVHLQPLRGA